MEQIKGIKLFERTAALLLPGFLYCFNIADFKRRNCRLGHTVGDADIAELDGLIVAAVRAGETAQRVGGDRWFMLSRANANERIQEVLDRYQRAEPTSAWRIQASRGGEVRTVQAPFVSVIRRAVRCLYTEVASQAELAPAIASLEANNWGLPVNRPLPLSQLSALPRAPWRCLEQKPEQKPACPFCGGQQFEWTGGDDCVSDGTCKGCGAEVSVYDVG
jgi:GGDEF domain-containing protein